MASQRAASKTGASDAAEAVVAPRSDKIDRLWGAEPFYEPLPEDDACSGLCGLCGGGDSGARPRRQDPWFTCGLPSVLRCCFFTWIGDLVYRAAKEELELTDLLGPVRDSRAYNCGRKLSLALHRQWGERHSWDASLGARVSLQVKRKQGSSSAGGGGVGILCYVGTVASYARGGSRAGDGAGAGARGRRTANKKRTAGGGAPSRLFAGVLWHTSPDTAGESSLRSARGLREGGPGVPLKEGQDAFAEATATWLNNETIGKFVPADANAQQLLSTCAATYEEVGRVCFLPTSGGGDPALSPHEGPSTRRAPPRPLSVVRELLRCFGGSLLSLGYWRVVVDVTALSAPVVLKLYISYLHQDRGAKDDSGGRQEGNLIHVVSSLTSLFLGGGGAGEAQAQAQAEAPAANADDWVKGVLVVLLFFAVSLLHNVASQRYAQMCYRCFYQLRSALSAVILAKALTIEAKSLSLPGFHAGRVVNTLTNDVEQLEQLCLLFWPSLVAPLQVGVAMYLLYRLVGWAVFAGFSVTILFVPLQVLLTYKVYRSYAALARAGDARLKATNEFLVGVQAAKCMSWEPVFLAKIQAARDVELRCIQRVQTLFTLLSFVTNVLPNLVTATLFTVYLFSGHPLRPEVIYPALSLVSLMCTPFSLLPLYANWASSFAVAMQRITAFLERADSEDSGAGGVQRVPSAATPPCAERRSSQEEDDDDNGGDDDDHGNSSNAHRPLPSPSSAFPPQREGGGGEVTGEEGWDTFAVEFHNATITAFSAQAPPSGVREEDDDNDNDNDNDDDSAQARESDGPPRSSGSGNDHNSEHCLSHSHSLHAAAHGPADGDARPANPPQHRRWADAQCFLQPVNVLTQISLKIPRGMLTVVVGPTGSGKSSLLRCLLGALEVSHGAVLLRDIDNSSIAYTPETPWLLDASIEDNILFYEDLDRERLRATLMATQLMDDLPALPDGIATRVGDNGISLSGGQQARLSLARAVYAPRKEVFLMDDPLSTLDPRVAQLVVEQCLLGMLKGKTRILATHQTRVAQYADLVVVLSEGQIEFQGSYQAYKAYAKDSARTGSRSGFVELSSSLLPATQPSSAADLDAMVDDGAGSPGGLSDLLRCRPRSGNSSSSALEAARDVSTGGGHPVLAVACTAEPVRGEDAHADGILRLPSPTLAAAVSPRRWREGEAYERHVAFASDLDEGERGTTAVSTRPVLSLADAEERARGPVPMSLYRRYITACGGRAALVCFIVVYALSEVLMVSSEVWLSYWSDHSTAVDPPLPSPTALPSGGGANTVVGASTTTQWAGKVNVFIYLGCVLAGAIGVPLRYIVSFGFLRRGSKVLHENLLVAVSRATLGFFDAVPRGRLLNRFARDVRLVDGMLVGVVISFVMSGVYLTSSLCIMAGSHLLTVGLLLPFVIAFYKIIVFNCAVVRTLQRLDNVATTPVVSQLSSCLSGRWTITAFHRTSEVLLEALRRVDVKFSSSYTIVVAQVWVAVRMQLLCACLLSSIAFLGILARHVSWVHVQVGLISLTVAKANSFAVVLSRITDATCALEASMNSVERVVQYTDSAPQEGGSDSDSDSDDGDGDGDGDDFQGEYEDSADDDTDDVERAPLFGSTRDRGGVDSHRRSSDESERSRRTRAGRRAHNAWRSGPTEGGGGRAGADRVGALSSVSYNANTARPPCALGGSIELQHVYLRYRPELPFVLQDLSFAVKPGERIGVVGRTGSGKSSLALILARLVEATAGTVFVSGRDVSAYKSVRRLRRQFAMIPQDPVLFDGTVRTNLDPLREHTDAEVWDALEHVGMADCCRPCAHGTATAAGHRAAGLQTPIAEGGKDLSVGQRQLLCLARALLMKDSRFLLMDEATANVDVAMERRLQQVVRTLFPRHTILSIAHRLHTVAQYDRILMLDGGRVVCLGTPEELMEGVPEGNPKNPPVEELSPFARLVTSMGPEAVQLFRECMRKELPATRCDR